MKVQSCIIAGCLSFCQKLALLNLLCILLLSLLSFTICEPFKTYWNIKEDKSLLILILIVQCVKIAPTKTQSSTEPKYYRWEDDDSTMTHRQILCFIVWWCYSYRRFSEFILWYVKVSRCSFGPVSFLSFSSDQEHHGWYLCRYLTMGKGKTTF